jgi:hypothetical protein
LNYSDLHVQEQVENLTQTFENSPYISSALYTESWLRSFVSYVHRNQDFLNVTIDTEPEFIKNLNEVRFILYIRKFVEYPGMFFIYLCFKLLSVVAFQTESFLIGYKIQRRRSTDPCFKVHDTSSKHHRWKYGKRYGQGLTKDLQ